MSFLETVQKAVHTLSPDIVNPLATSLKPDLSLLSKVTKSQVVYLDPPEEVPVSDLIHIGRVLTDVNYVIAAPQRETVRKALSEAGLSVGRVPGDNSRYFASSKKWSQSAGLEVISGVEQVQTFKCSKLSIGLGNMHAPVEKAHKDIVGIAAPTELQIVTGVVLEAGVRDLQGQVISEEEIFKTIMTYMLFYRNKGLQHASDIGWDVDMVESWQTRTDLIHGGEHVAKGSWMVTWKIWSAQIWKALKDGNLNGFSVGGFMPIVEAV